MIYVFSGLSGTGKTTIAKKVSKQLDIPMIVTYTTRPIRPGEADGIDYNFTNNEYFDKMKKDNMVVGYERVISANGDLWQYGICKSTIKKDCIIVLNPSGIRDLKINTSYKVFDMMITVDERIRLERILKRNDNQTKEEIERRQKDDLEKVFKDYVPSLYVTNNKDIDDAVRKICLKVTGLQNRYYMI